MPATWISIWTRRKLESAKALRIFGLQTDAGRRFELDSVFGSESTGTNSQTDHDFQTVSGRLRDFVALRTIGRLCQPQGKAGPRPGSRGSDRNLADDRCRRIVFSNGSRREPLPVSTLS